jgi:hypothetical protein
LPVASNTFSALAFAIVATSGSDVICARDMSSGSLSLILSRTGWNLKQIRLSSLFGATNADKYWIELCNNVLTYVPLSHQFISDPDPESRSKFRRVLLAMSDLRSSLSLLLGSPSLVSAHILTHSNLPIFRNPSLADGGMLLEGSCSQDTGQSNTGGIPMECWDKRLWVYYKNLKPTENTLFAIGSNSNSRVGGHDAGRY